MCSMFEGQAQKPKGICGSRAVYYYLRHGHIDDFPWRLWITSHKKDCKSKKKLFLRGLGAGLSGLVLECGSCKATRNLEHIFSAGALGGLTCRGRRPWLPGPDQECTLTPTVLQRGASNVYFPQFDTAISIPPWTDAIQVRLGQYWDMFVNTHDRSQWPILLDSVKRLAGLENENESDLLDAIESRIQLLGEPNALNLRWDEYQQLCRSRPYKSEQFQTRPESIPEGFQKWIKRIVRVDRLREVRVQTGFTRIESSPGKRSSKGVVIEQAPISETGVNWLPGVEVIGEGIFIELNAEFVDEWASQAIVRDRMIRVVPLLNEHSMTIFDSDKEIIDEEFAARFYLVHTFAHLLIRQLSIQSGYSSASLRERLYVGSNPSKSNGLLIFTSSPDSDGTLGGLQRLGRAERLISTIRAGLRNIEWCSSDPLCMEGVSSHSQPDNLAACHSCVMASETSCEEFNHFLDRALLTDSSSLGPAAFFHGFDELAIAVSE